MKIAFVLLFAVSIAACNIGDSDHFVPVAQNKPAHPDAATPTEAASLVLPLEVDIEVAKTFVRLGYALDKTQKFQSTEFLIPRLRTIQARQLIQLVRSYNAFDGEKVAQALAVFEGRVSCVEFGREGSPVIYIELPYWTHQREGMAPAGKGTRISDEENAQLVQELNEVFVGKLKADEFSVQLRRVRIWWN